MSRATLRAIENNPRRAKIEHLEDLTTIFERSVLLAFVPNEDPRSELSTVAVSLAVLRDGFESWKIHFMDLVDEFRLSSDIRLLLLPPVDDLDAKLQALIASITCALCEDAGIDAPGWASRERFLDKPWFVSGMESLKATAIVELAQPFRRNNIFVQENFLRRA